MTSNPQERETLKGAVARDNTTVFLGPDVDLDFSGLPGSWFPISFGRCVTLVSVDSFRRDDSVIEQADKRRPQVLPRRQGRSASSLGPVLRYGPSRSGSKTFLQVGCSADGAMNDHVQIAGFRLFGPSFGQQSTSEVGIRIVRCVDIRVSNMEIAGWAEQGVMIQDDVGPDQDPSSNRPGGRISTPDQIVVTDNYIHHNQQPQNGGFLGTGLGGHAGGYGVAVHHGAWAVVRRNVFDFNRHSVEASGKAGGYIASENLVLKGGGYHGMFYNTYTHAFDVHGTGGSGLGGDAGHSFLYDSNAFQYRKDNAIKIRGKPKDLAVITRNIFPHPGLEDDWGDDAIALDTSDNVSIGPGNVINRDTYGQYGVCDFDADGIDDLFLATGVSWWFSSYGELQWTFLAARNEQLTDLRFGYFDADRKCDVLAQVGDGWQISSGATGPWTSIGAFGAPLSEVVFGRFDPSIRDHRPNVTRRTTHAFRRGSDGQWFVTPLTSPNWLPAQSSSFPLNKLRFGDFTGDGVTDALAVVGGRWAISESANSPWRKINNSNDDDVEKLFIANLDPDDNVDDLLKLDRRVTRVSGTPPVLKVDLTWSRSRNGTEPWRHLKAYSFTYLEGWETVLPGYGFAGRFGAAPGGATLITDPYRRGLFYGPSEARVGASVDWASLFAY